MYGLMYTTPLFSLGKCHWAHGKKSQFGALKTSVCMRECRSCVKKESILLTTVSNDLKTNCSKECVDICVLIQLSFGTLRKQSHIEKPLAIM